MNTIYYIFIGGHGLPSTHAGGGVNQGTPASSIHGDLSESAGQKTPAKTPSEVRTPRNILEALETKCQPCTGQHCEDIQNMKVKMVENIVLFIQNLVTGEQKYNLFKYCFRLVWLIS